jgi:hypothetical protein
MKKAFIALFAILIFCQNSFAQNSGNNSIKILTQKKGISIRGLAVPNQNTIWASGSKGSIAKSVNGGADFEWMQVKGYESRDFRSIHAWDDKEVIIVAIAAPAIILKTKDGGMTWNKVYENADTSMFLDAINFKDENNGSVVGDPINSIIFLLNTSDKGEHWQQAAPSYFKSELKEGEAFFAASGSNIQLVKGDKQETLFISGGIRSRIFFQDKCYVLPLQSGKSYTGANGMVFSNKYKKGVIVGGDFSDAKRVDSAMVVFELGNNFKIGDPVSIPTGYKSGVAFLGKDNIVTCGTTGVDKWSAKDNKWTNLSAQSFHTVQSDKSSKILYLCGSKGSIAKLISN